MTVFEIVVLNLGFSKDGDCANGDVRIDVADDDGDMRSLTFSCACPKSDRVRHDALLIGEAIRQLRRMPEIRSGQVRLKFAKSLKPLDTAKAA